MIYFEMKPYAVFLTVYQENTRNKAFMNVCTLLFDFSKKYIRCISSRICLTKNCPCRYKVFTGHRSTNTLMYITFELDILHTQ